MSFYQGIWATFPCCLYTVQYFFFTYPFVDDLIIDTWAKSVTKNRQKKLLCYFISNLSSIECTVKNIQDKPVKIVYWKYLIIMWTY